MSAAGAIAILRDAYPRADFPDRTIKLYGMMLADLDPDEVTAAVRRLINFTTFLPTIGEIRSEVAEAHLGLPTPEEAWDIVTRGNLRDAPPEVRASSLAFGGRATILHSDNLTAIHAQFLKDYAGRRENAIRVFTKARMPSILPPSVPELGPTMADLPQTRPRPVVARLVQRWTNGAELPPPSDEEKQDAITVLRDGADDEHDPRWPIFCEAQRIMDEASDAP